MAPPQMPMSTQNSMSTAPCQTLQWTEIEKENNKTNSGERGSEERRERERKGGWDMREKTVWNERRGSVERNKIY